MNFKLKKLPTLLLVTDNPIIRLFFEKAAAQLDKMTLITTATHAEALEYLNRTHVSTLLLDDNVPKLKLFALCHAIRALKDYAYTPILVITGNLKKSFVLRLIKAGATGFLREPLEEKEFFLKMEEANSTMETQAKIASLSSHVARNYVPSTCFGNRTVVDARAIKLVKHTLDNDIELVLLLLEIDQYAHMQAVYQEKDIQNITLQLQKQLRKHVHAKSLIYNQGAGKFAIFIPHAPIKQAGLIVKRMKEHVHDITFLAGSIHIALTLSLGMVSLGEVGDKGKSAALNLERLFRGASLSLNEDSNKKTPPSNG